MIAEIPITPGSPWLASLAPGRRLGGVPGCLPGRVPGSKLLSIIALPCLFLHTAGIALANTETSSLPDPLTLEFAISEATRASHPVMLAAEAGIDLASAELEIADSNYALESELRLVAGYVEPNKTAFNQDNDDNSAALLARKTLYDFGVTGDRVDSADKLIDASRLEYELARQRQLIDISRLYFDVILSDLKFAWDNESMAMEYVNFDKTSERHHLKQVSDVELLQKESEYEVARTRRSSSETMQRTSRVLLAVAIDRPGELSVNLSSPRLMVDDLILEDLDALLARAQAHNATLIALRTREASAKLAYDASSHRFRPRLDATLEAYDYSRNTPNKDNLRARLNLVIPLTESSMQRTDIAEDQAAWLQASADARNYEIRLRSDISRLWLEMQRLITQRQELNVEEARAEIELDKARGEYELERRATLGDAMVNISRVRYQRQLNRFQLALSWMQMKVLTGEDPGQVILQQAGNTGEAIQ